MLNLNYIIIGNLPAKQKEYLAENLKTDGRTAEEPTDGWITEMLKRYPAEQSILISGSRAELLAAHKRNMASVGFLGADSGISGNAGEHTAESAETVEMQGAAFADMYAEGFEEVGYTFLQRVYERHHGLPWTILTTARCVVREFSMEYLDDLFALYAGEGMTDYIEPLYPYEQERAYQQAYIKHMYGFYGYGMWIVCGRETGELIGRAGVEHREELGGELELGYAIGVPYQRMGYATEVCTAILDYVRTQLESARIHCLIEQGNAVSEHFAQKLGFSMEEVVDIGGKSMKKYSMSLCY